LLQGGCALVGVGDDAGGGVDGPAGGGDVVGPGQDVGHHAVADAQGHGVDSGPGVGVEVHQQCGPRQRCGDETGGHALRQGEDPSPIVQPHLVVSK
jgi:hypothetical protein